MDAASACWGSRGEEGERGMGVWGENILQRTLRMRNGPISRGSGSSSGKSPGQCFASRPQSPPPSLGSARARWRHILAAQKNEAAKRAGEINSAGKTSSADAAELKDACAAARVRLHAHACVTSVRGHACADVPYLRARRRVSFGRADEPVSGLGGAGRVLEMCPHPLIALL